MFNELADRVYQITDILKECDEDILARMVMAMACEEYCAEKGLDIREFWDEMRRAVDAVNNDLGKYTASRQ